MTTQPKEQSHSARAPRMSEHLLQELLDNDGELKTGPVAATGVYRIANDLRATRNDCARLLAQNEMLRKALEEMLHYDSVGCVCPTEEIRSRNPCTTCKARAALEQT